MLRYVDSFVPHRPRALQLTPLHRRPNRSWSKVSGDGDGGSFCGRKNSPNIYFGTFGANHPGSILVDSSQLDCAHGTAFHKHTCDNHQVDAFNEPLADQLIQNKFISSRFFHVPCPVTNGFATSALSSVALTNFNQSAPGSAANAVAAGTQACVIEHEARCGDQCLLRNRFYFRSMIMSFDETTKTEKNG